MALAMAVALTDRAASTSPNHFRMTARIGGHGEGGARARARPTAAMSAPLTPTLDTSLAIAAVPCGVVDSHGVCPQVIHNLRFFSRAAYFLVVLNPSSSACFPMRD